MLRASPRGAQVPSCQSRGHFLVYKQESWDRGVFSHRLQPHTCRVVPVGWALSPRSSSDLPQNVFLDQKTVKVLLLNKLQVHTGEGPCLLPLWRQFQLAPEPLEHANCLGKMQIDQNWLWGGSKEEKSPQERGGGSVIISACHQFNVIKQLLRIAARIIPIWSSIWRALSSSAASLCCSKMWFGVPQPQQRCEGTAHPSARLGPRKPWHQPNPVSPGSALLTWTWFLLHF